MPKAKRKRKGKAARKKLRSRLAKPAEEDFDLSFPKAEEGKPKMPASQEPLAAPSFDHALHHIESKKRIPHAATAILGSLLVTTIALALQLLVLNVGIFYSLGLSVAIFVGFAILFYNFLEARKY
ncbi:MAG: hypothetical protein N3F07_02630 [Candidatus Micrarchaeota archaeon]|nr:hypothetical protein [Candidatus Micrarchaeota archaeon]